MTVYRLVIEELRHRWLSFLGGTVAVAFVAAGVVVGQGVLALHDVQTETQVQTLQQQTEKEMAELEDAMRKSMKGLGFNIYIFPEGQELGEVYAQGYASKTMPESYAEKLASSKIVSVNHLLPSLTRKITWPEKQRTVVLVGISSEVPSAHKDAKKPVLPPVKPGTVVVGFELHKSLGIAQGDTLTLMGTSFTVAKTHPARGSVDDISMWLNLGDCQELLGEQGKINTILALECNCATIDRLGEIRAELSAILPGTQIVEKGSEALARAEARVQAAATAKAQLAAVVDGRTAQRQQRRAAAMLIIGMLTVVSLGVVGVLALVNVRERLREIGLLRAIGVSSISVLAVLLLRSLLLGLAGILIGFAIGVAIVGTLSGETALAAGWWRDAAVILTALPVLACLAGWIPALMAVSQHPARLLRHE